MNNQLNYYAYRANKEPSAKQETLVFIHGASMEHSVWIMQSRYFAHHNYNVLAIDLPGHGLSETIDDNPLTSIEQMAEWLNTIVANEVGSAFHYIGHSMGSLIAVEAAANYNNDKPLKSLSLLGFSYPMTVNDALLNAAKHEPHKAYTMMTQFSLYSKLGGEPNPGFWSPGLQISLMENSDPTLVYTDLSACNNYKGGEVALNKINTPTLFLSGLDDKMAPAKLAKKISNALDNAQFIGIERCGHSLMSEKPDTVRSHLKQFIER